MSTTIEQCKPYKNYQYVVALLPDDAKHIGARLYFLSDTRTAQHTVGVHASLSTAQYTTIGNAVASWNNGGNISDVLTILEAAQHFAHIRLYDYTAYSG